MGKIRARFRVNGQDVELDVDPMATLLDVLREQLGLTGTKKGCDAGDCGACTVVMDGKAILSCLTPVLQAAGKEIVTVEGLAREGTLHPLQEAFIECGAVQCGFCTPGMLLSAKALLHQNPSPAREEVKVSISGNLCRCTGYKKIIDAIMLASRRMRGEGEQGKR